MNKERRHLNPFLKKVFIYFIGVFSTKILSLLLIPIYAYYVEESALGDFDYIVALVNIIAPLFYLTLWEAILKLCIKEDDDEIKNKILSNVVFYFFFVSIIAFFVFFVFLIVFNFDIKYFFILAVFVLCGATSLWQFAARALKKNRVYVASSIIGSITLIAVDVFFIKTSSLNFVGLCTAHILSQFVIFLVIELFIRLFFKVRFKYIDLKLFKSMVIFCFPLAINSISLWAYTSGSKIIIENFVGAAENGLYSFAAKFSILISLFSSILSMAVIEDAYSYESLEIYRIKMRKIIGFISKGYFCLIFLALPAIFILYEIAFKNTGYFKSAEYIYFLLLTALFTALSNNFGSSFQVTNKTKYILFTTIAGALVSIGLSFGLVSFLGIYGVLIGATIGSFLMMLLRAIYAYKATGLKISWLCNIFVFIFTGIEWFVYKIDNSVYIQIVMFAVAAIVIAFLYRAELSRLFIFLKKRGKSNE